MPTPADGMQASLQRHVQRSRLLRPGLHLHADDATDAHDFTATGEMDTGLRLVVLLDGAVDVSYGDCRVAQSSAPSADDGRAPRPGTARAWLVSVAQPERFERRARRGGHARRVSVGIGSEWLDQLGGAGASDAVDAFRQRHLAMHHWQPSARIAALAGQLTCTPHMSPMLQHLYLESRALELVGEALGSLSQHIPAPATAPAPSPAEAALRLSPHEHRRVRALHAFLQRDDATDLSLDDLAREAGVNVNTMQRHFRAVYGTTVFDFVRETRLQRARHALEHDGLTVGQASLVAGYNSAANFSTAYRKRFGVQPRLARGRV